MYKLVTCPETERLELVEYLDTPLGMLIHRCSKFRPVCALNCTRNCAVVLDRRLMERRNSKRRFEGSGPIRLLDGVLALDIELDGEPA